MLDATGKFPDGLLEGNANALGSYSSCLKIEANPSAKYQPPPDHPPAKYPFFGKFGGVNYFGGGRLAVFGINTLYGVCLPSSCTDDDFYNIMYTIDEKLGQQRYLWIPHMSVAHDRYHLEGGDILMM